MHSHEEPANLGIAKQQVISYFKSGSYMHQIEKIAQEIRKYIAHQGPFLDHQAIVFDFDDTLISTWPETEKNDFGYNKEIASSWEEKNRFSPLLPIQKAYHDAQRAGLKIIIITARAEHMRPVVMENLNFAGYANWYRLILRPSAYDSRSRKRFKQNMRKELEESGLEIVINVGDQLSDLAGGHAIKSFKLPNPAYYVH